ncbi:MAG: helix-turn-helix domain-containing protein [Alphaproteobacteria bacterium]|nr:helix-turn-helix domain-containing protein [Alphaproteobacteria bacterium]
MVNFTESEFDISVGRRIRFYRNALSLSQKDLAGRLGISYQQYQKYESGRNKVSISRLIEICEVYNISPDKFLAGVLGSFDGDSSLKDSFYNSESVKLLSLYYNYDPRLRSKIIDFLEAFVK